MKYFSISIFDYRYSTSSILNNSDYQEYIRLRAQEIKLFSDQTDQMKAYRILSALSYSIEFWLPTKYCGKNGIAYVNNHDFDSEIQIRKDWLTNFADIFSHDCAGALFGGWSPVTAVAGLAGASGLRALSKTWDGGW